MCIDSGRETNSNNVMKANELMIGDLLKWKEQTGFNDEDKNMILRVKNIFDDAIKIDGRFELYHISLFEPIPLTPEILKKNGFKEYDGLYRLDIAEGVFVNADFKSKEPFVSIHNTCYRATPICKYVHQLQQALRLCGIDKTIEL